jgi:EamA domain-containing membrane protein RarD
MASAPLPRLIFLVAVVALALAVETFCCGGFPPVFILITAHWSVYFSSKQQKKLENKMIFF